MPQRYFIDDHAFEHKLITGNDAHHIIKVMRMKPNDQMIVCNNNICHMVHITKIDQHVEFAIDEKLPTKEVFDVTLIQGLPKGSKIETVTKYATIFGVSKIIFVEMNRSISKEKNVDNKLKRLETIAKEAAELAHRSNVPSIEFIKTLKEINMKDFKWILVADENEKTTHLTDVISKAHIKEKTALIIDQKVASLIRKEFSLKIKNLTLFRLEITFYLPKLRHYTHYPISQSKILNNFDKS